jgi:hypothetical protein
VGLEDLHAHQVHFQRSVPFPVTATAGGRALCTQPLSSACLSACCLFVCLSLQQPHPGGVVAMDMSPDAMFLVTLSASRQGALSFPLSGSTRTRLSGPTRGSCIIQSLPLAAVCFQLPAMREGSTIRRFPCGSGLRRTTAQYVRVPCQRLTSRRRSRSTRTIRGNW